MDSSSFCPPKANLNATRLPIVPAVKNVYLSLISVEYCFQYFVNTIIILFSSIALSKRNKVDPRGEKKALITQSGNRKWGTHARVFSQILVHGNSKNQIDKETDEECKQRAVSMMRSMAGTKKFICQIIYSLNHYCHIMVATPSYDFLQVLTGIPCMATLSRSTVCTRHRKKIIKCNSKWKSYIVERETRYPYSLSDNTHIVYPVPLSIPARASLPQPVNQAV